METHRPFGGTIDKKIAALLGAAALTTVTAANASVPTQTSGLAPATTYRDLLDPVPNATAALKADDARLAEEAAGGQVQLAQYYYHRHHHHGYFGGYLPIPPMGPRCHWTFGRPRWNGYAWVRPRIRVCN